jgi:ABC-2 type transport system permease protein
MARLRWHMFVNGLRSIHSILDLGATGFAWILYSVLGLGLGTGLCASAYSLASRASWQYLPILFWAISYVWLMFPVLVASFQEQSDPGILLRFPVRFGSYFLLYLISGLMEASTFVEALCCLGVWIGIVMARPDLYVWAALILSVFAVFNILLVRAVFAWIDRWLAQRKTREILGAVFMVLIVSLLAIMLNPNRGERSKSHNQEEPAPFRQSLAKYTPLLKTANQVQQWLPPGLGARTLHEAVKQRSVAAVTSLNMLTLWVGLAGGA